MQSIKIFQLDGKDYFNEDEAAHYLGVSVRHFLRIREQECLEPIRSYGRNLYRRADLRRLIEMQSDKDNID